VSVSVPGAVATGSSEQIGKQMDVIGFQVNEHPDPVAMLRTLTSVLSQRERKEAPGSDTQLYPVATARVFDKERAR